MSLTARGVAILIEKQTNSGRRQRVFRAAAVIAAQRTRTALVAKTPTDMGIMRNAWKVVRKADTEVRIENLAPHAGIIERGARPHGVNAAGVQALREWVIRKGLVTYSRGPGRGKEGPARLVSITKKQAASERYSAEVEAIVWGIVKKLKEKGQKGLFIARNLVPDATKWLGYEFLRQLQIELSPKGTP